MSRDRFEKKEVEQLDPKRALEVLARTKGVALAERAAPAAAVEVSRGWLSKTMPAAAAMMMELKAQIGSEYYAAALQNLKDGQGYVFDESTGIALGNPPAAEFEVGKPQERDGYTVRRARRRRLTGSPL